MELPKPQYNPKEQAPQDSQTTSKLPRGELSCCSEAFSAQLRGGQALTPGTEPMLFIGTEWFMGDAARGPMGACGNCTFPKDIGLNEFIPVNVPTTVH